MKLYQRPTMTTTSVSRKDGTKRTKRSLTVTTDRVAYTIDIFENLEPRQPLDEFIAESNASFKKDPATERNLTVNDFPGKEYSSHTDTTATMMQFFATEDRLFRFAVTGPAAAASVMKEFFSSITLGPNAEGVDVPSGVFVRLYDGERVFLGREVEVKPRLLKKPDPDYTTDALRNKVQGKVILIVVFSKTGRVENIEVRQGLPYGLTEGSIKAAREIEFVPAMKDGKPVSMYMQLEYSFSL
ncbi:MAG TPA: energy transducer TonB [Pyrinomonadaceae bacterium]|nr:energy transducer TonB [Pyrinomonadaceae bacterium]